MTGTSANFEYWRKFAVLEAWQLAALMHGVDPGAMGDVVVRDPNDPKSPRGIALDLDDHIRMLHAAVLAREISAVAAGTNPLDGHTRIKVASMGDWLTRHGFLETCRSLLPTPTQPPTKSQRKSAAPQTTASAATRVRRSDLLRPLIDKATQEVDDPTDASQVFTKMRTWAEQQRPPLKGVTQTGIQWVDSIENVKELSIRNLRDRLRRG